MYLFGVSVLVWFVCLGLERVFDLQVSLNSVELLLLNRLQQQLLHANVSDSDAIYRSH